MSFTTKDYSLQDAYATERNLLKFAGFYPTRGKCLTVFLLPGAVTYFISYGQLLTMAVQMFFDRHDLLKFTESLTYFLTQFTFLCKLFYFRYYDNRLMDVENFLISPVFYKHSFQQLEIIKKTIWYCDVVAYSYRFCCISTISFYGMLPYIDERKKGSLPLPGLFPYDTEKYYFITVFAQVFSVLISAYGNSSIDLIIWKMLSLASAQFEILKDNLVNIDFSQDTETVTENLIKCVKHHKQIIKFINLIMHNFSKGMFLQLLISVLVICTTCFQMVLIEIPSIQFMVLLSYFSAMLCQIAMFCWYGHGIMKTSETIGQAFYMSNWYNSDPSVRKLAIIFVECIKQPTLIKAGNFITLSLATFTQILRSSYSYFAVLNRLYNDM